MRFRKKVVTELRDYISQLGLRTCSICGSETLTISDYPVLVNFGGWPAEKGEVVRDPEANVWFAAKVECSVCGHMLFFNSEAFHSGDTPVLIQGVSREDEEKLDPPDEPI